MAYQVYIKRCEKGCWSSPALTPVLVLLKVEIYFVTPVKNVVEKKPQFLADEAFCV